MMLHRHFEAQRAKAEPKKETPKPVEETQAKPKKRTKREKVES